MDLESAGSAGRFSTYIEGLTGVIGHADRAKPLRDYCVGLLMPGERKSVEPMAALTSPQRTAAQHQSLLHFVGEGRWSDERVLAKVRQMVLPAIERHGPIEAFPQSLLGEQRTVRRRFHVAYIQEYRCRNDDRTDAGARASPHLPALT